MGRGPSSANCHTCRIRRVRCDKAKPVCGRCEKSGLKCQGYKKILRIQSHGVASNKDTGTPYLTKIANSDSYPVSSDDSLANENLRVKKQGIRRQDLTSASHSLHFEDENEISKHQMASLNLIPSPNLSLAPFLDNITMSYFFDAYSWINVHSILLQDTPMRQHLVQQSDDLNHNSIRALCYGIFSRDHHMKDLRQSAACLYSDGLRKLQSSLATASKSEIALLIKPIAIMGSYAIAVDGELLLAHHDGLARVIEHCGPTQFQSPTILPVFESCRLTLIASAIVRRKRTFLEHDKWRTDSKVCNDEFKTNTSKLLDVIARIPGVIQGTDDVLNERAAFAINRGARMETRMETSDTILRLQERLNEIELELSEWRQNWEISNTPTASNILEWTLYRTGSDSYRPGIFDCYGPDAYSLSMSDPHDPGMLFGSTFPLVSGPRANSYTFTLMQDAALYLTTLIWIGRLRKNLNGAALGRDSIDFYNAPFYTECRCYYEFPGPGRRCQVFPQHAGTIEPAAAWNINAIRISESPVARSTDGIYKAATQQGETLLPGDGRFAAQLRILRWLIKHLPHSRTYVLGTLAAMGLSHCVHDVRPLEGNESIAEVIRETMAQSGLQGTDGLLLRNYNR